MPMFNDHMSSEQKVFLAVGQFVHHFTVMEAALNKGLRALLNLGILEGAIVTSNVDVRTKVYIVKTAINTRPMKEEDWLREARRNLEAVVKMAERRNILAHNPFMRHENGVEFFYTKAKGDLKLPDEVWTYDEFDRLYAEMERLASAIEEVIERVVKHPATALGQAISETLRNFPREGATMIEAAMRDAPSA